MNQSGLDLVMQKTSSAISDFFFGGAKKQQTPPKEDREDQFNISPQTNQREERRASQLLEQNKSL